MTSQQRFSIRKTVIGTLSLSVGILMLPHQAGAQGFTTEENQMQPITNDISSTEAPIVQKAPPKQNVTDITNAYYEPSTTEVPSTEKVVEPLPPEDTMIEPSVEKPQPQTKPVQNNPAQQTSEPQQTKPVQDNPVQQKPVYPQQTKPVQNNVIPPAETQQTYPATHTAETPTTVYTRQDNTTQQTYHTQDTTETSQYHNTSQKDAVSTPVQSGTDTQQDFQPYTNAVADDNKYPATDNQSSQTNVSNLEPIQNNDVQPQRMINMSYQHKNILEMFRYNVKHKTFDRFDVRKQGDFRKHDITQFVIYAIKDDYIYRTIHEVKNGIISRESSTERIAIEGFDLSLKDRYLFNLIKKDTMENTIAVIYDIPKDKKRYQISQDILKQMKRVFDNKQTKIKIKHSKEKIEVPYKKVYRINKSMLKGETTSIEGQSGKKEMLYDIYLINNVEYDRRIRKENVIRQKKDNIIDVGVKERPAEQPQNKIITVERIQIPYRIIEKGNKKGKGVLIQKGHSGMKAIITEKEVIKGKLTGNHTERTVILTEKQDEIIEYR